MGLFRRRKKRRSPALVTISEFSLRAMPRRAGLPPRARKALWVTGGIVLLYLFVIGDRGAWRLLSLLRLRQELAAQELSLSAELVDLDTRHRLLESDTTYIEMIARTEYRLSRPDETIYELTTRPVRPAPPKGDATP
ncbi:MAG: septum formation initiator family protein [Candidatus Zixiibacteriota bacterium]